jgi:hypothetical protein
MKNILACILLFLGSANLLAQVGEWTWVHGLSTSNSLGSYGSKGISSQSNEPPGMYEGCSWTDLNGNFWLYGGINVSTAFQAMWKYDPVINQWTWMSGDSMTSPANFGVQGIPSPNNLPPGISWGAATWVDQLNNLWLYGGNTFQGEVADLWKYNTTTNEWTWMKGPGTYNSPAVYGNRTIPDTANNPGQRYETRVCWIDGNNLWLFGGMYDDNGYHQYNDLWKYDILSNTWTWMKGPNIPDQQGQHSGWTVEDSLNEPDSRPCYAKWKDSSGNFWFFGGGPYVSGNFTYEDDLWKFNPLTNNWAWMGGNNPGIQLANTYGTKCIPSTNNWPLSRRENSASWVDDNGDFWMFGGETFSRRGLNDLWKYCVQSNEWIWISGDSLSNSPGNWGTQGVSAPTNVPSERMGSMTSKHNNDLYLFGGGSANWGSFYNDLWKFVIDSGCGTCPQNLILPQSQFSISASSFCEGTCVNFINQSVNATTYQWYFPGAVPSSATTASPQNICYYTQGNYDVTLVAANGAGTDSVTITNAIVVFPPVQFSPITRSGDTLFSNQGYVSYQWYLDSTMITGANNFYYVATQSGNYSVQVEDSNGCSATAIMIDVIASAGELSPVILNIVFAENNIILNYGLSTPAEVQITLNSDLGQLIYSTNSVLKQGNNFFRIDNTRISPGIYFITLSIGGKVFTKRIFID